MSDPPPKLATETLVSRAQAGSVPCFTELVRLFEPRLFNFVLRRTGSVPDAEDVTQETFVRAWQRLGQYNPRWQFSTWLFTIGHRQAMTLRHRNRRRAASNGAVHATVDPGDDPGRVAARREQARLLWDLADRVLTDRQRTALWLRYAEDLPPRDIARVLGTSQVVVRVTLFRARERLAACSAAAQPQAGERNEGHAVLCRRLAGDLSC